MELVSNGTNITYTIIYIIYIYLPFQGGKLPRFGTVNVQFSVDTDVDGKLFERFGEEFRIREQVPESFAHARCASLFCRCLNAPKLSKDQETEGWPPVSVTR